jgi:Arc/MetJ-type ribon-helix-helix transcriptional regulator
MKTLTVRLPDSLVTEIEEESRSRHISKSDVVRERLHQPSGSCGPTGELLGDILRECWNAKVPSGPPQFRSSKKQKIAERIRAKKLHRR